MHANWEASLLAIPVSVEDAFLADRSPFISHRGTQHRCVVGSSMTYTSPRTKCLHVRFLGTHTLATFSESDYAGQQTVEVYMRFVTFICWRLPSSVRGRQICLWVCVAGAPYSWKLASRAGSVQLGCLFVLKSMSGITWMCTNRMSGMCETD